MSDDVATITAVKAGRTADRSEVLIIVAGEVPTLGWSDPTLDKTVYVTPPADGIQDYRFVATKPDGVVGQSVTPIAAFTVDAAPEWLRGVRVNGVEVPV